MASSQLVKEGIARARANGVVWSKGKRGKHYARVLALYRRGWNISRIAAYLGLRYQYVYQLIRRVEKGSAK